MHKHDCASPTILFAFATAFVCLTTACTQHSGPALDTREAATPQEVATQADTVGSGPAEAERSTPAAYGGANPHRFLADPDAPPAPPAEGVWTVDVPSFVYEPPVTYRRGPATEAMEKVGISFRPWQDPVPRQPADPGLLAPSSSATTGPLDGTRTDGPGASITAEPPKPLAAPALDTSFTSVDYETNITETGGFAFIPADPHSAAGPNHVVNVVNVVIRFHQKDGTVDFTDSLMDFFSSESPDTFTFDPKVVFDPIEGRFVVVTLEREDDGAGGSPEDSEILVAVSDDADPNGTWCTTTIDSVVDIGGTDHWADYPGLATDEEAIYITTNMFEFFADGGSFGGVRLWTIAKGVGSSGLYDCGTASVSVTDPYAAAGVATTTMPAQIHGPAPDDVGTFLVSYSGLTAAGSEAVQVVRVDDPLGSPTFTQEYVDVGDIEDFMGFPGAPQSGTADTYETNDRRALDAEWFDDSLYVVATINPKTGDTDAGEATAYWWELDTSTLGTTTLTQDGPILGDDLVTDLFTFFPSVAVNGQKQVGFGYSGGAASNFPSSYYTMREAADAAGATDGTTELFAGAAFYFRTFCGGTSNRWGDYTAAATDPVDGCFWFYNKHAMSQGRGSDCDEPPDGTDDEEGRWTTGNGKLCPTDACPVDMFLADMTLSGTETHTAASRITTGASVAVADSADVTFKAADLIVFRDGFSVGDNATFVAEITATPCP